MTSNKQLSADRLRQPGVAVREAALDVLTAILREKRGFDDAFDRPVAGLPARDRALAHLQVTTVLRHLGEIDFVLRRLLRRLPSGEAGALIQDILRLGLAQLRFLDTPLHAVAATALAQCERRRMGGLKRLVDGILRRAERESDVLFPGPDKAGRLNTPDWLWRSWQSAYGEATAAAIAESHRSVPSLDLTLRDPAGADEWARQLDAIVLPTGSLRRAIGGAVAELPGYTDGAWWIQDAAACLPARLFGPVAGLRIADLCAAPGGKTAQLAAAGAHVTAVDRSGPRLVRVGENLARLGLHAECVVADAAEWQPEDAFDAVLLDAPCSATGTMRRHPDIAFAKRPEDIADLVILQDRLLERAITLAKPGAPIVWCTCSLQPEEGPERIARLLDAHAPVVREAISAAEIGGLGEILTPDGDVRSLPCHGQELGDARTGRGLDGFHITRLRRIG